MKSLRAMIIVLLLILSCFLWTLYSLPLDGRAVSPIKPPRNNKIESISSKSYVNDENTMDDAEFLPAKVICELNGFSIPAIIDTGAQITIMSSSCAKRCRVANLIDTKYACRAIGVGSSEILGSIENLPLRIGPISFQSRIAILRDSPVDFLIGMDFLRRFKCDLCLSEGVLKLRVRDRAIRVPFMASSSTSKRDIKEFQNHDVDIEGDDIDDVDEDENDDMDSDVESESDIFDDDVEEPVIVAQSKPIKYPRKVNIYSMKSTRTPNKQTPNLQFDGEDEEYDGKNYRRLSMEGV